MAEENNVSKEDIQSGQIQANLVPAGKLKDLSPRSDALECFTNQTYSRKLQEYLLNYRTFVTSDYSVNDE